MRNKQQLRGSKNQPDLAAIAEYLRQHGQGRDKVLAHINPEEAQFLNITSGGTINPETGLPQFGFFRNPFKAITAAFTNPYKIFTNPKRALQSGAFLPPGGVLDLLKNKSSGNVAPSSVSVAPTVPAPPPAPVRELPKLTGNELTPEELMRESYKILGGIELALEA